jgi:hypothetical protein
VSATVEETVSSVGSSERTVLLDWLKARLETVPEKRQKKRRSLLLLFSQEDPSVGFENGFSTAEVLMPGS